MIRADELQALIDTAILPLPAHEVPLEEARGLQLAEELLADADEPAFDRSAMDGFAIAKEARGRVFVVMGETPPGEAAAETPGAEEALRVYTGSALPPLVKVVMQEDLSEAGGKILVNATIIPGRMGHVRRRGSALKKGELLIPRRTTLTPAAMALLASTGVVSPRVIPRPRVAHLTTGSEIVSTDAVPGPGQIRNCNAPLMKALVEEAGAAYTAHHHVDESLTAALHVCEAEAFQNADLLLISGGSSKGKHDHTAELLEMLGFSLICRTVNCRPGKPFLLGIRGNRVAVGLPGNPVSHFVTFHLFVRRIICRLAGWQLASTSTATLQVGVTLASNERETFWPALLSNAEVAPLPWLDSGHLGALLKVNALIRIPASTIPDVGSSVEVIPCGTNARWNS